MKKITAVIRPSKLDDVKNALFEVGVHGLTASDVKGFGKQKGYTEHYRGSEVVIEFIAKTKIEVVLTADKLDAALTAIVKAAKSNTEGKVGDGKIFVSNIEHVTRVSTGDINNDAL